MKYPGIHPNKQALISLQTTQNTPIYVYDNKLGTSKICDRPMIRDYGVYTFFNLCYIFGEDDGLMMVDQVSWSHDIEMMFEICNDADKIYEFKRMLHQSVKDMDEKHDQLSRSN